MYRYCVELFDENDNLVEYEDCTADGYCAEINARKKYPNYRIGNVIRLENKTESDDKNKRKKLQEGEEKWSK